LQGLAGIIAFVVIATVLVGGPKVWTMGEALANLSRSLTAPWGAPVVPPVQVPDVPSMERAKAVVPAASPPRLAASPAPPPRAEGVRTPAPDARSSASRRSRPTAAPASAKPALPAAQAVPSPEAARRQHFYAVMDQGIRLYRAGWFGPSAARFRQAVAIMPASPYAYLWLGRANLAAQRPAEARAALERVIALAPDSPPAREAALLLKQLAAGGI